METQWKTNNERSSHCRPWKKRWPWLRDWTINSLSWIRGGWSSHRERDRRHWQSERRFEYSIPPSKEVVLRTRIFPSTFKTNEDILLHTQSRGILQTFVWVGGKFVLPTTNVCKISRSLGSCSFARFRRIIFKLGKSSLLRLRRFERCQRIFAKWSPSKLSVHLRIDIKNCEELTTPFYLNQ